MKRNVIDSTLDAKAVRFFTLTKSKRGIQHDSPLKNIFKVLVNL